jgi:hypothetical protein
VLRVWSSLNDRGYRLRDAWWGVATRASVNRFIDIHQLRIIDLCTKGLFDSLEIGVETIGGQLNTAVKTPGGSLS